MKIVKECCKQKRLIMKYTLFIVAGLLLMGISAWATSPVHALDATVTDCGNFIGADTISDAIADANTGGGTITFACSGTIIFSSNLTITDTVVINANGNTVIFDGGDSTQLFAINGGASLTLNNITLQNGINGAVSNAGTLTINNSTLTSHSNNPQGAAIANTGTLIVSNSTFTDNNAGSNGGAIYNTGTATITNSTFTSNGALFDGGAIWNSGTMTISGSLFQNNIAIFDGGAIENDAAGSVTMQNNHFANNTCNGTLTDNGGNTIDNAAGCLGVAPTPLDVSALTCNEDSAIFTINAGDGDFSITGIGSSLPISPAATGLYGLVGPDTWTNITITELFGDRESVNIGGITCPEGVVIPPTIPPTPPITVLGCALDVTDGVDIANAPDNTYCRILMKNGAVVDFSGAIPADLISLGVILAVDVYRLEGGMSVNTFPAYAQVCLAGQGRLFYMDGRNAPRVSVEMPTESVGGLTCAWIPAPGTLILTETP
jgi:predicted outer membrane repeat protein